MKRRPRGHCALLVALLVHACPAAAQDLSGSYAYDTGQGVVLLELEQSGSRVTGVMQGIDGSINRLDGTFDGRSATGTIATQGGSGWFAAGFLDGGLTLIVADYDPATGEPDVDNGWRLDFVRAGGGGAQAGGEALAGGGAMAGGGAPGAGGGRTPQPGPPATTALTREWTAHLAGKKVTFLDSYDSGGSGGYSERREAFLCSDGSFHYRSSSSVSADVGGVFGNSSGGDSFSGTWRVIEHNGQALLQYQQSQYAGSDQGQWIALSFQNGQTFFDGARVYVTADNTMCR